LRAIRLAVAQDGGDFGFLVGTLTFGLSGRLLRLASPLHRMGSFVGRIKKDLYALDRSRWTRSDEE
jgi:hypothetical protein